MEKNRHHYIVEMDALKENLKKENKLLEQARQENIQLQELSAFQKTTLEANEDENKRLSINITEIQAEKIRFQELYNFSQGEKEQISLLSDEQKKLLAENDNIQQKYLIQIHALEKELYQLRKIKECKESELAQ